MQTSVTTMTNSNAGSNGRFLRRVLYANALFSGFIAVMLILAAGPVASFTGLEYPQVYIVLGIGLLPFAGFAFYAARQVEHNLIFAKIVLWLDVAWVVVSFVLLLGGWLPLTTAGKWAAAFVDDVVAVFAVLEYIGLRRLGKQ
jgi:hypothetical protein